jgi:thioredoxin 1
MMKKIFICLVALVALVACNNKSDEQANNNAEAEQAEAVADDTPDDGWMKQTTLLANKPMVVDFFATCCGPCKELAPVLDELEKKYEGEVIFQRIDVDQRPELAQEFRIEAIPMLMFITPKGDYKTLVGYQDAPVIEAQIAELLKHSTK